MIIKIDGEFKFTKKEGMKFWDMLKKAKPIAGCLFSKLEGEKE